MIKKQIFLAPLYGIRSSLEKSLKINDSLLLRNINLIDKESDYFKTYNLQGNYNVVLEINYKYNSKDPSEPVPGVFLNIVNKFDASLVVFGDGKAGVAAVIPDIKSNNYPGGEINFSGKVGYGESLDQEINENFIEYYEKFSKAYDMRPVAFDVFRRSQDRNTNNDKTIDSCIILESIFVPIGERLKKPFILNGLKILGYDLNNIKSIDDLIEYRNAIIHADRKKQLRLLSSSKYTYQWFKNTFKLIRKILRKYVDNPWI